MLFRRPPFVHCHLFEASLIGLSAARLAGIKKRIHTRHHSNLHHQYHPRAVKYDRLVNRLSTHIIAVSRVVENLLVHLEQVPVQKVMVIPHGIPLAQQLSPSAGEVKLIRAKYGLNDKRPVIGVVSRFVEWKGVQFVIPAFAELLKKHHDARLVLCNAGGNYSSEIRKLLENLPPENIILVEFEENMRALFRCFDVFVHVPVDEFSEAFGQVYLEAFILEVPVICTISGIAAELVQNNTNALVVPYRQSKPILEALECLLADGELRLRLTRQGRQDAMSYTFEKKYQLHKQVYLQ